MTPEILPVDEELRLRAYAGPADVELAWSWYGDEETVSSIDCSGSPACTRETVGARYDALAARGELYLIERRSPEGWEPVGDVALAPDHVPIVVAPGARRQGIARRALLRLVDRARVLGWDALHVREVSAADDAALRLFTGLGFVARPAPPPAMSLRLSPLAERARR